MKTKMYLRLIFTCISAVAITGIHSISTVPADRCVSVAKESRKSAAKSKKTLENVHYYIEEDSEDEELYMRKKNGKKASGWFIKTGEDYLKLKNVSDFGMYHVKSFKLVYANSRGLIPTDRTATEEDFYFNQNGVLRYEDGVYRIEGKYYLLRDGRLQIRDQKYQKKKYLVKLDGSIYGYKKGSHFYSPKKKRLSAIAGRDLQVRLYAREIIRQITKRSMTKGEKLQACFQYIVRHYNYAEIHCSGEKGWTSKLGIEILRRGIGDCRGLAVGFAYLSSELGYEDTYLCQDSKNVFSGSHCWTSVNGKYYDPLFYNTRKPQRYLPVFNGSTPEAYRQKTHCSVSQRFKMGD